MWRLQEKATIISECIYNRGDYGVVNQETMWDALRIMCWEALVTLTESQKKGGKDKHNSEQFWNVLLLLSCVMIQDKINSLLVNLRFLNPD